jgi:VanZ family protein
MFFGLTCVIMFDYGNYVKKNNSKLMFILTCIVFPIFLGGAVEILQPMYFAPRTAEWFDWFSDITGVLIGWLAMRFIFSKLLEKIFK